MGPHQLYPQTQDTGAWNVPRLEEKKERPRSRVQHVQADPRTLLKARQASEPLSGGRLRCAREKLLTPQAVAEKRGLASAKGKRMHQQSAEGWDKLQV